MTEAAADCGNGKLEYGEDCDDGNEITTDDCTNDCRLALWYVTRAVDTPDAPEAEECDDGNSNDSDGCTNGCRRPAVATVFCVATPPKGSWTLKPVTMATIGKTTTA